MAFTHSPINWQAKDVIVAKNDNADSHSIVEKVNQRAYRLCEHEIISADKTG